MELKNKVKGINFSKKEQKQNNSTIISKYEKRIIDLLHIIEFKEYTPNQAYKTIMKLQGFLRKRRSLKNSGKIYTPRTETGKVIVNGKIKESD